MPRRDAVLRSPVALFLAIRAAIWVLAVLVVTLFEDRLDPERLTWDRPRLHELGPVVDVWARWDSDWYIRIAEGWYDWPSGTPAFFPLYPTLVGGLGRILVGQYVLAGVIVSLVAATAAVSLLYRLVAEKLGSDVALLSIAYLAVFPTSLFLGAVYSEAVFLLLAISAFLAAEKQRPGWAGLLTGLAILTRFQGVAILPALAWFVWRSPDRRRSAWTLFVPVGAFLLYPLALWASIGHPLAFQQAQAETWQRSFDFVAPLTGVVHAVGNGEVVEAIFVVGMVALAIASFTLVGVPYGLYASVVLWIPLTYPTPKGWLYSFPRLCLVAFPCYVALARLTVNRPRVATAIVAVLATGLTVYVIRWALWDWVA